jgi:hypothetical protein
MSCRPAFGHRLHSLILGIAACVLVGAPHVFAQSEQLFKGQVIQCRCGGTDRTNVPNSGAATGGCPVPCSNAGAGFLLLDPRNNAAFQFDKDDLAKRYASREVLVIGILDSGSRTIRVNNVIPDVPPKLKRAKTVSIVCDACPRAMAKTSAAALEELAGWGRFKIDPNPKNAELIFLISANPYLGDYVTRDGPDKRVARVETVYMNVVDPQTGESVWGDRQRVGSWFVASATKDLIDELREIMEADVSLPERKAFLARNHIYRVATNPGK